MPKLFPYIKVLFFLYLFSPAFPTAAAEEEVAVIISSQIKPFVQALEGFRRGFPQPVTISYVDSNPVLIRHNLAKEQYALIVAIGPEAAKIAWSSAANDIPKIVLMVLDPHELLGSNNPLCGVHLRVPASEQLRLLSERMGPGRKVGIIYNPRENQKWMTDAGNSAMEAGLTLVPLEVSRRQDIEKVLSAALEKIDTLLFIPDSTVISETMVRHIIKKCLLSKIAVAGYNNFFIEAGAVMAITINYQDVGILGAKLAENILTEGCSELLPPLFEVQWNQKAWDFIQGKPGPP
jgi:putative tryptophan/tyrosine transport system substrate-binding protein